MSRTMDFGGSMATRRDMMMDSFDPNAPDDNEWATYIPRWRGAFHTHKDRSRALRALNPRFAVSGVLYHKGPDGHWTEIHRHDIRDEPPLDCEICGKPAAINGWDVLSRGWIKERDKVVDPPRTAWMCDDCRHRR